MGVRIPLPLVGETTWIERFKWFFVVENRKFVPKTGIAYENVLAVSSAICGCGNSKELMAEKDKEKLQS